MKKSEIKVGGFYTAKVNDKLVTVRVDKIEENCWTGGNTYGTVYRVTNLSTGRTTTFRSAAKFRVEAKNPAEKTQIIKTPEAVISGPAPEIARARQQFGGQHGGNGVSKEEERQAGETLRKMDELEQAEAEQKDEADKRNAALIPLKPKFSGFAPKGKVEDTSPHVVVEARAGTGKTTTLVEGLKVLKGIGSALTPSPQQKAVWDAISLSSGKASTVCFVAFNKSIADELAKKVTPLGFAASTMHSMGFKAVRNQYGNVKVNEYRVQDIISELLQCDIRELRRTRGEMIVAVEKLVGLCKMNLVSVDGLTPNEIDEELETIAGHYEIELLGYRNEIFSLVPRVLARCLEVDKDNCIDYSDMIWLPVAADLSVFRYDILLVDEAQDLNRCQQALAKKAGKRLILCGDPKQAIYGFAGADAESMPRMLAELKETDRGCLHLPLTVTRRCGKKIVAEAKKIVPDFDAFESNPEGIVSRSGFQTTTYDAVMPDGTRKPGTTMPGSYRERTSDGDMILCRVNAPLVSECFKFIKTGRKATIQGRDIAKGLVSTITRTKAENVTDLVSRLSDWLYDETRKENAKRNPSEQRLINLQDRYDCLMCFIEGATTVQEVMDKIDRVFTDDKSGTGIRLSSIHKAKGLEAHRVFLLEPKGATVPHPMAKSEWQKEQEWNLRYVAITRAINELVYVTEPAGVKAS